MSTDSKPLNALNFMFHHGARFFSGLFSPLLMPTYGTLFALWTSILCYQSLGSRLAVLLVIFSITCLLPMIMIAVLHFFKVVEDKKLDKREERWLPYLFTIGCYVASAFYLGHVHAPDWMVAFMWGGAVACLTSLLINFLWKISAHTAGIAGVVAFLFYIHNVGLEAFNLFWLICGTIIVAGAIGTSRLRLNRHTFWQVIAGFVNGYLCVYITLMLLG